MKKKNDSKSNLRQTILFVVLVGLVVVTLTQAFFLAQQRSVENDLQEIIFAQKTEIMSLRPTQTRPPTSTPRPSNTPVPTSTPDDPFEVDSIDRIASNLLPAQWSPDGELIAFGSSIDRTILIYDFANKEVVLQLEGLTNIIRSLEWSPDGQTIAASDSDQRLIIWNVHTGEILEQLRPGEIIYDIKWSPDSQYLATAAFYEIMVWHTENWEIIFTDAIWTSPTVEWFAYSQRLFYNTGLALVITDFSLDSPLVTEYDIDMPYRIVDLEIAPHQQIIISAGDDGILRFHSAETGNYLFEFVEHFGEVNNISYSPDGQFLASGGDDDSVIIWHVETREPIHQFSLGANVHVVDWSPDGNYLLIDTFDILILDVSSIYRD